MSDTDCSLWRATPHAPLPKQHAGIKQQGIPWHHDAPRHSNASHWLGAYGSFEQLCTNMGNTLYIAKKHYVAHATEAEGKEFFSITPPTSNPK